MTLFFISYLSMDQIIRIKRSYIRGSVPASLEEGEIAINIADKYIYASDETGIVRLYSNATQTNDGLLSSVDKTKLDKIITSGNGDSFLSNSGEYKSIVSSLVLDYAEDLKNFSGVVEENVIQNIQEAIEGKIPIYISLNGTIQYLAFAAESDSEIVLSIDSVNSENIISILATINISTRNITSTVNSQSIYHPIILLNYTDDLKNGNLGESVSQEVSQKLLDAINGGWACVVKSGNSDILCNLQKVGDVVTIIMESITKIDTEYFAATTIIGVNTSSNTITYSDSGGLYLVDKDKVLLKDNTTSYTPTADYNPSTKKYIDDSVEVISEYTINSKKISENPVLGGGDIITTGYQRSTLENDALEISETDTINSALGKLEKSIIDNEEVTATALIKLNTSLGFTENGEFTPTNTNLQGKNVTEALDWICEQINILTQALTLNQV